MDQPARRHDRVKIAVREQLEGTLIGMLEHQRIIGVCPERAVELRLDLNLLHPNMTVQRYIARLTRTNMSLDYARYEPAG